jgi:hypothetical protein
VPGAGETAAAGEDAGEEGQDQGLDGEEQARAIGAGPADGRPGGTVGGRPWVGRVWLDN